TDTATECGNRVGLTHEAFGSRNALCGMSFRLGRENRRSCLRVLPNGLTQVERCLDLAFKCCDSELSCFGRELSRDRLQLLHQGGHIVSLERSTSNVALQRSLTFAQLLQKRSLGTRTPRVPHR